MHAHFVTSLQELWNAGFHTVLVVQVITNRPSLCDLSLETVKYGVITGDHMGYNDRFVASLQYLWNTGVNKVRVVSSNCEIQVLTRSVLFPVTVKYGC